MIGISEPNGGFVINTSTEPKGNVFLCGVVSLQVTAGERERIHVKDMPFRVGCHQQVHSARANEEGIEIGSEQILVGVIAEPVEDAILRRVAESRLYSDRNRPQ